MILGINGSKNCDALLSISLGRLHKLKMKPYRHGE